MQLRSTLFRVLVLLLVGFASANLKAAAPNPPTQFNATSQRVDGTSYFNVTLTWIGSTYDDSTKRALGYHIYMADSITEDQSLFSLIATVTAADSGNYYRYVVEHLSAGSYTFFIKAFNNDGESNRTPIKSFTLVITNTNHLHIVTTPPSSVAKGGTYHYELRAFTSDSANNSHIRYKIIGGPDGMTIDSMTGNITWTAPNTSGTYTVHVLAYLDNDDSQRTDQTWTITVGDGNNSGGGDGCCLFAGTVKDSSGNAMSGTVRLYRLDSLGHVSTLVATVTLVNGHFTCHVPPGTYVLRAQGDGFEYEWYNNAKEPAQAEHFTVGCQDTTEIHFEVTPLAQEQMYTFTGHVTDADNGNGLQGTVYFYPIIDGNLGTPVVAHCNGDGVYTVQLSNRYSYYAKAVSGDAYLPVWYDNVGSPSQATVLHANENKSNINFALPHRQTTNNGMSGQLVDSAGTGIQGRVTAYLIVTHNNDHSLETIRTVETDSMGHYSISNLTPGHYVLLGIPSNSPFVSGYYRANNYAASQWANATQITMDSTSHSTGLTIKLDVEGGGHGIVHLHGQVNGQSGITNGHGGVDIQSVTPLSGALLVVFDANNKIVSYTFSGSDGSYDLTDLPLGNCTVSIDRVGYTAVNQKLNFNGTTYTVQSDATLDAIASSVTEDAVTNSSVAPNPADTHLNLSFQAIGGQAQLRVLNAVGQTVQSLTQELQNGQNQLSLDCSTLPTGAYYLNIGQGSRSTTISFRVVH